VNRAGVELFRRTEHQRPVGSDRRHVYEDASDAALLQASSNGDERAFASLYERHARKIYNDVSAVWPTGRTRKT
jgi:hypothetical protein